MAGALLRNRENLWEGLFLIERNFVFLYLLKGEGKMGEEEKHLGRGSFEAQDRPFRRPSPSCKESFCCVFCFGGDGGIRERSVAILAQA